MVQSIEMQPILPVNSEQLETILFMNENPLRHCQHRKSPEADLHHFDWEATIYWN